MARDERPGPSSLVHYPKPQTQSLPLHSGAMPGRLARRFRGARSRGPVEKLQLRGLQQVSTLVRVRVRAAGEHLGEGKG